MPGLPHAFFGQPPAYLGFVGFVRFQETPINAENSSSKTLPSTLVRATSADISLSQEITRPEVIDSRYDRTLYQLGPQLVEGSVSFPATYDLSSTAGGSVGIVEGLYRLAASRTPGDGLLNPFNIDVKYAESDALANEAGFVYDQSVVNTWQFSVTQSEIVNITVDIVGVTREGTEVNQLVPPGADELRSTRIVTWNDARVEIIEGPSGAGGFGTIGGNFVRSFEANINNNVQRYYTLNGELFPQAIAPTKRDVNGNMVLIGRHKDLGGLAVTNEQRCFEDTELKFGFSSDVQSSDPDRPCATGFNVTLPSVVFEIETIALTNDLFESTVNWHCLLAHGTGIPNTEDPLLSSLDTTTFSF
jgi:hypothetical protein